MARITSPVVGATGRHSREIEIASQEPISKSSGLPKPSKENDGNPNKPSVIPESKDGKRESARQKARLGSKLLFNKPKANNNNHPSQTKILTSENLESLATPPRFVKKHEEKSVNKYRISFGDMHLPVDKAGKVPLSKVMDPNVKYMWSLNKVDENSECQLVIGYENTEDGKRYGHPTLFENPEKRRALIAGELKTDKNGKWIIDNDSGRFGSGNTEARKKLNVPKHDLLLMAKNMFNEHTDLSINIDVRYSEQTWLRVLQKNTGHFFMRSSHDPIKE